LLRVVNFEAVAFKVPEEVSCTYSISSRLIIVALLLRGGWCHRCLLLGVVVDLTGVEQLLT
jgi:hypothetical protein